MVPADVVKVLIKIIVIGKMKCLGDIRQQDRAKRLN